jgi:hypothetical protein
MNSVRLTNKYGEQVATKLIRRLADLSAASVGSEIFTLPGKPYQLSGSQSEMFAYDLINDFRLTFQPVLVSQRGTQRHLDWSRVRRIKIIALEKYDT